MAKKKGYDKNYCWNCGNKWLMVDRFCKCDKCGATFTDLPTLEAPAVKGTYYHEDNALRGHHWTPYTP